MFPGEPNLSIGPIVSASPERTDRFLDYFFGADVEESWIAELLELDDAVGREDTALVERVQTGVASGALESGGCSATRSSSSRISRGSCATRWRLTAAEEPAARPLRRRLGAEGARAGGDVLRGQRRELVRPDLVEPAREPQRVRVHRLLEQRAREARVAEALASLRAVEDAAQLVDCALVERVLALGGELLRDRDELVGRVVRKRDLAREAGLQARDSTRGSGA